MVMAKRSMIITTLRVMLKLLLIIIFQGDVKKINYHHLLWRWYRNHWWFLIFEKHIFFWMVMIFVFEEIFISNLKPVLDSSTRQLPPPQIWKKHKLKKEVKSNILFVIFMGNTKLLIYMIKVIIMIVIVMKSPLGQAQTRIKVMINQCAYVVGSCYHI